MGSLEHLSSQAFPSLVCARFLASGWVSASDALNCGTAGFLGSCCLVWGICNVDFGACGFVFRPHLPVLGSAPVKPQWSTFYSVSRRMDFMHSAGRFSPSGSVWVSHEYWSAPGPRVVFEPSQDMLDNQQAELRPSRTLLAPTRRAGFRTLLTTLKKQK